MKITLSLAPFIFFGLSLLSAYASDTTPRNIAYIYGDEEELLELVSDGEPVASDVTHYIMAFLYSETTSAADLQLAFAPYDNTTAIQAPLAKVFKELQDSGAKVMLGFGGASMNSIGFWSNYADDYDTLAQVVSEFVKGTEIISGGDFKWDGVDIDWEDSDTSYEQAEFLYNFTASLRSYLPSEDGYLISHAPQGGAYTAQKYLMVEPTSYHYYSQALAYGDLAFGDNIDWLNVQFYNQGGGYYTDGDVTSVSSGNSWMDTQDGNWNVINDFVAIVEDDLDNDGTAYDYGGLDSSKVVVGKPISDGSTGIPTDASSMAENIVSVLYSGGTTDDTITGYGDDFGGTFLWINLASSDTVDDIESWTSTLADAMSSSTTSDVWGSSESVSNDHYHNDSLGYVYYDSDVSDWTYSYVLGWMYPVGDYDSGLWLYVNDSISWVFVSVSLGAYSYHQSTNSWYYFDTTLNAFLTVSIIE